MICHLIFLLIIVVLFSAVTGENCGPPKCSKIRPGVGFPGGRRKGGAGSCECGISIAARGHEDTEEDHRIIGGIVVQPPYKYPWMVGIYRGNGHTCGGAFITQTFVLTAAHCFLNIGVKKPIDKSQVFCVTSRKKKVRCFVNAAMIKVGFSEKATTVNKFYKVKSYINHPKYELTTFMYDIALIELQRPIRCSPYIRPICLPDRVPALRTGTVVTISGWGRTHQNPDPNAELPLTSKRLMEATVSIQHRSVCRKANPGVKPHICVLGREQGVCKGDSGGPLFYAVNRKFYVFGVTSFGRDNTCNPKNPQFFTDVKKTLQWIHKTTKN